jgi:hypothetical protein
MKKQKNGHKLGVANLITWSLKSGKTWCYNLKNKMLKIDYY